MQPASESRFDANFAAQILLEIAHEHSLEKLLQKLVDRAMERPHIVCAQVWLIEKGDLCATCPRRPVCPDQSRCLHLAAAKGKSIFQPGRGFGQFDSQTSREPLGVPSIGSVVVSGQTRAVSDLDKRPVSPLDPAWMREEGIRGYAINPISYQGEALGAIVSGTREPLQEQLLPWGDLFANHIGAAIAHARAFEEVRVAGKRLEDTNQKLGRELAERKEAEDKLRESEQRYHRLVDTASEGIWELDEHYVTTLVNRRMAEMLGYEPQEMLGRRYAEFLFEDDLAKLPARVAARHQGLTERYEQEFRRKDGSTVWMYVSVTPILDAEHRFLGSFAMLTDITERKGAEDALRGSNRKLRAISNCNQVLLRATNEQGLLQEICRIVCEEAGYRVAWVGYAEHDEAKSVRPAGWTGIEEGDLANLGITWADTERGRGPTGTAIRTGRISSIEDYATDPRVAPWRQNALRHGFRSVIALPLKDEKAHAFGSFTIHSAQPNAFTPDEIRLLEELAGDLAFGIVALRSRAARQRAEQEVALLSFALDKGREAAFLIDDTARFQYVNEEACRLLSYTRAELLGLGIADIDSEFPLDCWSEHWRDLKAQRSRTFESRHRARDGRIFPVEISANYFEFGGRAYHMALVRDITERKRAEEALRESETRFRTFVDHAADALFIYDFEQGTIVDVNRQACEGLGYTRQELIGTTGAAFHLDSEQSQMTSVAQRAAAGESVFDTHWHRRKDGTLFPIEAHTRLYWQDGRRFLLKVARDITDRRRAEAALRAQADLLNLTHDAVFVADMEGVIKYWNRGAEERYGWTADQTLGRVVHELLKTVFPKPREEIIAEVTRAGQWEGELIHAKRDGTQVVVASRWSLQQDEQNAPMAILETNNDITERKRTEDALRRSEAYLAEGQKLTHTGSWALDVASGNYNYVSEEDFRIFGFDPRAGLPTREVFLQRVVPEDRNRMAESFQKSLRERVDTFVEYRIVLPDGTMRHIYTIRHPVQNDAGEVVQMVGTSVDITERKRVEDEVRKHRENLEDMVRRRTEQLGEAKARAEAANREKSRFLANMSHELRTPLNAVLGFSRLLKRGPDVTPRQQETLDIIVRSGEHLLNLINNILDMAKIESGRMALEESEVDLHRLLHEMQSLMGAGAAEKGLRFALERDPDLPSFVGVDASKLRQVLLNLLGNAIKYTDSGGVKLRARLASIDRSEKAEIRFDVEDSGRGISQEDCQRIFFPFVQLGDQAPAQAGTGLGLAICKQYVELMGGQIGVTSKPGKGSVFYFTIPVRVLPSVAKPEEPKRGRVLGLAEGQPSYRLLIVEDQPENRLLLRSLLEPLGFELREAGNGQEALALFEQWHPNLIWMDIRMPVMDGLEAVRRIRATKAGADITIIALTAHALEEERTPILTAGCDDLVRKPFREQELFDALARHLHLKFIYGEAPSQERTQETSGLALHPEQLDALPAELLRDLRQAVIELDTDRTHALIGQVTDRDASLGRALNTLATQLDYKRLLKLLERQRPYEQ
jgi:PAS domain S-box-containing protein